MFDDVLSGFIRGVFKFLTWLIVDTFFDLVIEPLIYSTGRWALRIITLGRYRFDNPSWWVQFFIYMAGTIILFAGLCFAFYIICVLMKL